MNFSVLNFGISDPNLTDLGTVLGRKSSREKLVNVLRKFGTGKTYKQLTAKKFVDSNNNCIEISNLDKKYLYSLRVWNILKVNNAGDVYINPILTPDVINYIENIQLENVYTGKPFEYGELTLDQWGDVDLNKMKIQSTIKNDFNKFYTFILINGLPYLTSYKITNARNKTNIGNYVVATPKALLIVSK